MDLPPLPSNNGQNEGLYNFPEAKKNVIILVGHWHPGWGVGRSKGYMILPSVGPTPSLQGILAAIGQCIGTFDARDGKAMGGTTRLDTHWIPKRMVWKRWAPLKYGHFWYSR